MRLLRADRLVNKGVLEFEDYVEREDRPPYAILSHTWDEEEVSYQDVKDAVAFKKEGY